VTTSTTPTSRRYLITLSLGALGVVYGDIGTSPLYALKECFMAHHGHQLAVNHDNVIGVLSLITWSLILVISVKYLLFVLRADNRGEGGILALMSLVRPGEAGRRGVRRTVLLTLGLFGSALLYGDGMITPAITMLSAFEGVGVVTPMLSSWIVPLTVVALIALFAVQRHGTARVGLWFGPLMMVWFAVLAVLGVSHIVRVPSVLIALNPFEALRFLLAHQVAGYLVLGAVFLVVTGGEALYADMGHFGAKPIRLAWFSVVFPALLLNYYGQGALLLTNPAAASDPFFHMAPKWALWPLVLLSTLAAAVASQAVISGSYSLTRQAVQLAYLPRLRIRHTSAHEIGQIYIPSVNWVLMLCAIGLVLGFRESTALAGAYGVAVTATMGITTALFAVIARERWKWRLGAVLAFAIPFLVIDLAFFGANIIKITDGGWFPLLVGLVIFTLMTTWFTGRRILTSRLADGALATDAFLHEIQGGRILRVRGTAVFLARQLEGIPTALLHNIKHNKVVHERVVLLTVLVDETPHLTDDERAQWTDLGHGVHRLTLHFGFMEDPNLPEVLQAKFGSLFDPMTTSYFLGRETLLPSSEPGMAIWREHLFAAMARNATGAATFFSLPPNQVIELGAQVRL
jgi:KUP system potassium uptake protein